VNVCSFHVYVVLMYSILTFSCINLSRKQQLAKKNDDTVSVIPCDIPSATSAFYPSLLGNYLCPSLDLLPGLWRSNSYGYQMMSLSCGSCRSACELKSFICASILNQLFFGSLVVFILQCLTALDLSVVMLRHLKQSSQGIFTVPLVGVTICDEHALGIYQ